jgi:flagellar basal-body rod modification protein FlgD
MASAINWLNPKTGEVTSNTSKPTTPPADPLTSKATFLNLLVAQLKNQDPLSPQDGSQFVAQLAQFSELEQVMQMSSDVGAMRQVVAPAATATTTSGADSSTNSGTDSGGNSGGGTGQTGQA